MLSFITMRYRHADGRIDAPRAVRRRGESGQVFVLTAMALIVLVGFASMALDVGFLWNLRRKAQAAADAAASAGMWGLTHGNAISSALHGAAQNGFTNGVNNVTVKINNPPASGPYAGDPYSVEAIITQTVPTFFMAALGYSSVPVTARAVAHRDPGPTCIYVLNPSAAGALSVSGTNATIQAQCGIQINSNASNALNLGGGACISATNIGIVGNWSGSCSPNPTPITGDIAATDPLANVAAPQVGACTYKSIVKVAAGSTVTLSPGVYCGGINIAGSASVTFNPGTYILNGGGFSTASGANLQGTGVTFYNTGTSKTYVPISMSGGTNANLSAPTSGPLEGILFFEDRSINVKKTETVAGGPTSTFDGALYFANDALAFSGGSSTSGYLYIVANTVSVSGNASLNANYSSLTDGPLIKTTGLVE
jgi:putative Flp pilus-assembly TadE/G-like protein